MHMRWFALFLLALGSLNGSSAFADPEQSKAAGETHRILQFENEQVRVWKTIILPNQPLKYHRHDHPRILVALTDTQLRVTEENKASSPDNPDHVHNWKKNNAYWLDADPKDAPLHGDVNESDHPMEVMVIELKK